MTKVAKLREAFSMPSGFENMELLKISICLYIHVFPMWVLLWEKVWL